MTSIAVHRHAATLLEVGQLSRPWYSDGQRALKEAAMKHGRAFSMRALGACGLLFGMFHAVGPAQEVTKKDLEEQARRFTRREEMIPMRDGVKLYTTIYAPKEQKASLPFVILRIPTMTTSGVIGALPEARHGADDARRRLVRPGGLLRPALQMMSFIVSIPERGNASSPWSPTRSRHR